MILETIVTSRHPDGRTHIAPMGIREDNDRVILAPFRPSTTLEFVTASRCAVVNRTTDVRVFAGCLTGHRDWPLVGADLIDGVRLRDAIAHTEIELERIEDDAERPRLVCRVVREVQHGVFRGFNRAQAAVIEASILASRLDRLAAEKIDAELAYLTIAIDKTAGPREHEAWRWLLERIDTHRKSR